jgi:diaminohydroxyphosphoribosylaminopyrimidine deaminase/5-amino-6-(5-phosphoribosylamino)uracil reductase
MTRPTNDRDHELLTLAARRAMRGHGGAEPNPMVGCIITNPADDIVGAAHHARCGSLHAERGALVAANGRGRGGTAYVTLEPCAHHGRTPPCTDALIEAGVRRVVFATRDPNPAAAGGEAVLRAANILVTERPDVEHANRLNAPFLYRCATGLPWVTAKWAQTLDGCIATSSGDSKWISGPASRRLVHRERGRVDAILTGIGTVLADDPRLDARGVRVRRNAARVLIDPALDLPLEASLLARAPELPLIIATHESASPTAADLRRRGAVVIPFDHGVKGVLRTLAQDHAVANVLVEAGGGLLGTLFSEGLVNAALVFTAPIVLGDQHARHAVRGLTPNHMTDGVRLTPLWTGRRGDDLVGWYAVT